MFTIDNISGPNVLILPTLADYEPNGNTNIIICGGSVKHCFVDYRGVKIDV